MKNKAVFLDRDGTINVDYGYVYKLENLKIIDGVAEDLLQLQNVGYLLIIITNQSGVGRGFFSEEDVFEFNAKLISHLAEQGVEITDIYVCYHSPDQVCECRKPSPKMIKMALDKYNIDPQKSFMIGDKQSDVESGENAGVTSFLIDKNNNFNAITRQILESEN